MKIVYNKNYEFKSQITDNEIKKFIDNYKENIGWMDINKLREPVLIEKLKEEAINIRKNCDIFLVVGIGGSYIGSKAIIDALNPYFKVNNPQIIFVGNSLSSEYLNEICELIFDKEVIVNYISKSGNTLETKIAFEKILEVMKKKYHSEELKKRIIYTTGNSSIVEEGFTHYDIPSNIGGRYSLMTTVGILPMLVADIDIDSLFDGAMTIQINEDVIKHALYRDMMAKEGKQVEAFVCYEPKLYSLLEWLKQLYAESLGKDNKGLLPISLINTTDLHSMGQFVQEGNKILFETVIDFNEKGLNKIALESTYLAHTNSFVPNAVISFSNLDAFNLGCFCQFFMMTCAISGLVENVNPFNQDGVEIYKKIMKEKISEI